MYLVEGFVHRIWISKYVIILDFLKSVKTFQESKITAQTHDTEFGTWVAIFTTLKALNKVFTEKRGYIDVNNKFFYSRMALLTWF